MNGKYSKMSKTELLNELSSFNNKLEDVEEMRQAVLSQTGHHVPGRSVKQFADQIKKINSEIETIKLAIQQLDE